MILNKNTSESFEIQNSKPKHSEQYEISQKYCPDLGFSVVMQRPLGSNEEFKCLSSSVCGNKTCSPHTS